MRGGAGMISLAAGPVGRGFSIYPLFQVNHTRIPEVPMRNWILILAILLAAGRASAHEDTWLQSRDHENASYFAPKMRVSHLADSLAFWPGAGLGWIVGSVISVGFEGYML